MVFMISSSADSQRTVHLQYLLRNPTPTVRSNTSFPPTSACCLTQHRRSILALVHNSFAPWLDAMSCIEGLRGLILLRSRTFPSEALIRCGHSRTPKSALCAEDGGSIMVTQGLVECRYLIERRVVEGYFGAVSVRKQPLEVPGLFVLVL
jgi:hypothetical protein